MNTKLKQQNVILRTTPCKCGCKGQDPWHKRSLKRTITLTTTTTGTCKMPWGDQQVERKLYTLENGKTVFGGWKLSK